MEAVESAILVGAGAADVTPEPGCYLAGFIRDRVAVEVHDPLWARAVAVQAGGRTAVLVAVDCLGLLAPAEALVAERVGLKPGHLVLCATHTHSGPDTIGLWGPDARTSGVAPAVVEAILDGAVAAGRQALETLRPALLTFTRTALPQRTLINVRDPHTQDRHIAVLHAGDAGSGRGIATLVNLAGHPETLQSATRAITSDYVHRLRVDLEQALGGVAVFANGALGAMVTVAAADESFAEADRIGAALAGAVTGALRVSDEVVEKGHLAVASREVELPVTCPELLAAMAAGLLPLRIADERLRTRVTAWSLGPATLLMVPGELQPAVGQRWKRMMGRRHRFLIGLASDEIGYVLDREDYDRELYDYERTRSLGPDTATLLETTVQRVLAAVDG